jgi:DnaJ-class molecular chaperone
MRTLELAVCLLCEGRGRWSDGEACERCGGTGVAVSGTGHKLLEKYVRGIVQQMLPPRRASKK